MTNQPQVLPSFVPIRSPIGLPASLPSSGTCRRRWRYLHSNFLYAVAVLLVAFVSHVHSQSTWVGPGTDWNTASNWSPSGIPNSASAAVNFTGIALGTVNISANVSAQSLSFTNATGSYNLTSSAGVSLSNLTAITIGSGVTATQTINLANIATGSLLFPSGSNLTITNNSTAAGTTLVIGPNTVIGSPGSGGVIVAGVGTTQISGALSASSPNNIVGGLTKNGTGTLILSNSANTYTGGTFVNGGTLMLGSGTAIPTGGSVTVADGATFNTNGLSNGNFNAIGTLTVNGAGTFRVPTGSGDYYLNQLAMSNGTVNFTGTSNFWLHFTGASAGITINAGASNWTGAGTSRIQNDTANPLTITGADGTLLNAGIILSSGGSNPNFNVSGGVYVTLSNTGNTANISVNGTSYLFSSDLSTNVGSGAFGTLGTGTITLAGGGLAYTGNTNTSSKPLTLTGVGGFTVLYGTVNLTMNGVIGQSAPGAGLNVYGSASPGIPSTLTLTANNSYSGATKVGANGVLAIPSIGNAGGGGTNSPLGASSNAASNLQLGNLDRGDLLLTGANPTYSTDRGVTLLGLYASNGGGGIGVQNGGTNLNWNGQITGAGSLIKTGAGVLTLNNANNNYTGGTYVEGGRLTLGTPNAVPAGQNVTVLSGGTFDTGGQTGNSTIGTVTLSNGTLRAEVSANNYYFLDHLSIGASGGTIDGVGGGLDSGLGFVRVGASITVNGNCAWNGTNYFAILNYTGEPLPITIATGATVTSQVNLSSVYAQPFTLGGGGTLYLTNPATYAAAVQVGALTALRMDDLTSVSTTAGGYNVSLDGGTLRYGGGTASATNFALTANGGTIEVMTAATKLTLTGAVAGFGPLAKTGPGTLVLGNAGNLFHGLTINAGAVETAADNTLGNGPITVNPLGTLRYTSNNSTSRMFALFDGVLEAASGVTLTFNGATIGGGFLRGAGMFALTGGASLTGTTTFSSTSLNVAGPASVSNFSHNGNLVIPAGQTLAMNYATNGAAGRMTVNGTANVSDFVSYGQISVPNGGLVNNTGSLSGIVLGGGSTTFVGTQAAPGGVINVGTQPMLVRGGLLVNNGAIGNSNGTGRVIVDYGGFAKGAGYYDTIPQTINGGRFSPGNSPGRVTVGSVNMNPGGIYDFEINNATGIAGPTGTTNLSGWDLTIVSNAINPANSNLTVTATQAQPFTINLVTLRNPSPPDIPDAMANFSSGTVPFSWLAFDVNPAGSVTNWDPSAIVINTSQVMNTFTGTFGIVRDSGNPFQFYITYTPVPEPALTFGAAFVGFVVFGVWRKRVLASAN